jgi:hypothetical protein
VRRLALLALSVCACAGENPTRGASEPIRVYDVLLKEQAQFKSGKLPGRRPLTDAEVAQGAKPVTPNITSLTSQNGVTSAGATGKVLTGRASPTAAAVGVEFVGAGSGYWLVPTGSPDPMNNGELAFSITVDFSDGVPTGNQRMRFVALDEAGRAGTQFDQPLCIAPLIPDNLNACRATIAPPALVLSLDWDRSVDLDLELLTPEGKFVDPKHPSTAPSEGDGGIPTPLPPDVGVLDRDSNAGCVDGHQHEDLVFQEKPPKGHYLVYANLFDSCGEAAVRFVLSFHASQTGKRPGTFEVVETYRTSGEILGMQENGGSGRGLYLTEFDSK